MSLCWSNKSFFKETRFLFVFYFNLILIDYLYFDSSLHGVLTSPFSSRGFVLGSVSFVKLSDFGDQRIIRIRISQQWANREENFRNCKSRAPLVLQNVQANVAIWIDVWMINATIGCEGNFRWFEGIIRRESNAQKEDTTSVRTIRRTHNGSLPIVH